MRTMQSGSICTISIYYTECLVEVQFTFRSMLKIFAQQVKRGKDELSFVPNVAVRHGPQKLLTNQKS